jgi:hypothetical protein
MKKFLFAFILMACCSGLFAQYKKATFFGKEGRTYGFGTQYYSMGDGKESVLGYSLSFGRDEEEERLFSFWEIRMLPSFKFEYESKDFNDDLVTVTGKSKLQFVLALNYGYYLVPNENDRKFKPYVTAGINFLAFGGAEPFDDAYYEVKRKPAERTFNVGAGGGLGTMITIGGKWSVKLEGGYNFHYNLDDSRSDPDYKKYFLYTSHAYASAGIRYRLIAD